MNPQILANGLITGSIYALVALGFGIIYHTTHIFHVAHGAIYVVVAYLFYACLISFHIPFVLSIFFALLLGILLAYLIERFVYYPLHIRDTPLTVILISSLGVYLAFVNLIALIFGNETKIVRPGVESTVTMGSVILTSVQMVSLIVSLLCMGAYFLFLKKSSIGRYARALANNPTLLSIFGVDEKGVRAAVFAIGSLLAGIGAILLALDVGIDPHIGLPAVLTAAVVVIIAGIGSYHGIALGAFGLGVLQNLVIWNFSAKWQESLTFGILILFLLLKPEGIFSRRQRLEEA